MGLARVVMGAEVTASLSTRVCGVHALRGVERDVCMGGKVEGDGSIVALDRVYRSLLYPFTHRKPSSDAIGRPFGECHVEDLYGGQTEETAERVAHDAKHTCSVKLTALASG